MNKDSYTAGELLVIMRAKDVLLRRACCQVILLNNRIQQMKIRYDRVQGDNHSSFKHGIKTKMLSLVSIRNIMYHYADMKNEELEDLRVIGKQLLGINTTTH